MLRFILPLILAGGFAATASAATQSPFDPYCARIPRTHWLSSSEIAHELSQRGLQLVQIRLADQKCYAVRVQNAAGKREELILDPMTGEVIR